MLNFAAITSRLADLPIGWMRVYDQTGSTNVDAARWAEEGAPDLSLILADEQTAGKGRHGRAWFTPPGGALAFSLVLLPRTGASPASDNSQIVMRYTALGTLAVCTALEDRYGLSPKIKWPNDVLLAGKKTCGVLAESHWQGDHLSAIILGIGINIAANSAPPEKEVAFPATYLENHTGRSVDRLDLLHFILESLLDWRQRLDTPGFVNAWDERLAFKNEWVHILNDNDPPHSPTSVGLLVGLDPHGQLILKDRDGNPFTLLIGELRLRPAETWSRSGA